MNSLEISAENHGLLTKQKDGAGIIRNTVQFFIYYTK